MYHKDYHEAVTEWTDGKLCVWDGKMISPRSIQNPSDPDANYRSKQGNHIGYVANVVETVHTEGNIILLRTTNQMFRVMANSVKIT